MAYRYAIRQEGRLLVVVFEGVISPEQEREALLDVAADPGLRPDARALIDRRRAQMQARPSDVEPQIELARGVFTTEDRPRMAIVVDPDHDLALMRMLERRAQQDAPHEVKVFRALDRACEWLGIAPEAIEWP